MKKRKNVSTPQPKKLVRTYGHLGRPRGLVRGGYLFLPARKEEAKGRRRDWFCALEHYC